MTVGVDARLDRLRTDSRYVIVPMDHGVTLGAVEGLENLGATVAAVTAGGADAVLTQKGMAPRVHPNRGAAGYVVHLNASTVLGPDSDDKRLTCTVEEALRVGADAVSIHINVGSPHEPAQLEDLAQITESAHEYGLPVLAMAYARGPDVTESDADDAAHAVRITEELGADLVKTAYTGDPTSFARVTAATRLPVLIAGGDPAGDRATLEAVADAIEAGAAGVSLGRTIFQHEDPTAITTAVSAIVHDDVTVEEAVARSGLAVDRNH
ncbi:MAG: 2-amino-3,7-dideoxy-D-threo-hept-6-ulosonate synthase [Halobacteriaceae archaeon]